MSETILSIKNLSKSFPGVRALDNVSFDVSKGEIHALIGENGAGKSTLIKILSGIYKASEGTFLFKGKEASFKSPLDAQLSGIGVVHQELKLVETLSVAENIFLGRPKENKILKVFKTVNWKGIYQESKELMNKLNVKMDVSRAVSKLSVAQKQIVEICKTLSMNTDLIIMDEPSATLTERELNVLFDIMKTLRKKGVTIIYISHRMDEIFELADTVTVLRDGKHIKTMDISEVDRKKLISMMVGRDLENEYPKKPAEISEVLMEVKNLTRKNVLHDISFSLKKGEILGIAGLVGSGRTEVARAIFGVDKKDNGEIVVKNKKVKISNVNDAISNGIGLIPEDRKLQGLVLGMSVKENISLAGIDKIISKKIIRNRLEKKLAEKYISMLRIVTPDESREVKYLSGGNQQKVVLAKWLTVDSEILIFDEPTRGIDVGSKAEIYLLLNKLVQEGKGIIMISSELPEILGMCDRILVMHDGRITGEIFRDEACQEIIMEYAIK